MENLMDAKEVAMYLRKSYSWVVQMLQQGKIRAYKAGGGWRVEQKALDDYLRRNSNRRAVFRL